MIIRSPAAVMAKGAWSMPMGTVSISEDFAAMMVELSDYLEDDAWAHTYEHSLEVQIPFLQYRQPNLSIVDRRLCTGRWICEFYYLWILTYNPKIFIYHI